ncbi:hypothetical protein EDB80DRAFT_685570 [Ilyonectria destructans]|nr:hypothetical protein EDB80DRAFT_685570 [Ilyonectria destructans]
MYFAVGRRSKPKTVRLQAQYFNPSVPTSLEWVPSPWVPMGIYSPRIKGDAAITVDNLVLRTVQQTVCSLGARTLLWVTASMTETPIAQQWKSKHFRSQSLIRAESQTAFRKYKVGKPSCSANEEQSGPSASESSLITRFIGDSNAEARLFDETTTPKVAEHATRDEVGLWIQPRSCSHFSLSTNSCSPTYSLEGKLGEFISTVSNLISKETITVLWDVYFDDVHPITPLLNEKEY